ncbi:unnamed protein product [Tilletia controversa]|uniref:SAP domain-containing protein n=1 Tax=Tilletia controversa TaxID=13291 RepID=A0A8X7MYP3_9BASI|nr:hypothetical protein CF328_g1808 [Tilletia controversa]KAE8254834.1 hypothetical protein A4X06_0g720 [Tilletia controversa]CAD6918184.1 unnamed protein product [Tilletia controversa]CAD6955588.1 unnamed protein product [Tilletia controversa]CAD6975743.1 unnamed protein product [Tilletia controversa]
MFRRSASACINAAAAAAAASSSSSLSSASIASTNQAWRRLVQQPQHRTLTSTVLLTRTREQYEARRMPELKDELRQRGLATSGKRDELVRRLLNDDVRRAGSNVVLESPSAAGVSVRTKTTQASTTKGGAPRTPPTSDSATPNASTSSSLASLRAQSSPQTSSTANKGKEQPGAAPPTPPTPPPETDASTPTAGVIDSSKVISAGVAVDKDAAADEGTAVIPGVSSPQIKGPVSSNPPGVPPQREAARSAAAGTAARGGPFGGFPDSKVPSFNIKIPYEEAQPEEGPKIPIVTSYFHPGEKIPEAVRAADEEYQSNPKVVAVGGSEHTEIAHHATDAAMKPSSDSKKSGEDSDSSASGAITSLLSEFRKDLGLPSPEAVASVAKGEKKSGNAALDEASKAVREALASVIPPDSGSSSASKSSSTSSSNNNNNNNSRSSSSSSSKTNRPLNSEERTGAYLLGAIVFGGLFLGGVAAPADPEKKEKRAATKEAVKEKVAAVVHTVVPSSSTARNGERGRVNKAMEDVRGASSAGNFATGQGIVGGAVRKDEFGGASAADDFSTGQGIVGGAPRKW